MGMFDSLYEGAREWQTKAYHCNLDEYHVGDPVPLLGVRAESYQVEILSSTGLWPDREFHHSLATVLDGVLVNIDNERAHSLPLVNYSGQVTNSHPDDETEGGAA